MWTLLAEIKLNWVELDLISTTLNHSPFTSIIMIMRMWYHGSLGKGRDTTHGPVKGWRAIDLSAVYMWSLWSEPNGRKAVHVDEQNGQNY